MYRSGSIQSQVLEVLTATPLSDWDAAKVRAALNDAVPHANVQQALALLAKDLDAIRRVGRGVYTYDPYNDRRDDVYVDAVSRVLNVLQEAGEVGVPEEELVKQAQLSVGSLRSRLTDLRSLGLNVRVKRVVVLEETTHEQEA